MVKFKNRTARDSWLAERKKKLTNGDIYSDKNDQPIYINENLTKRTRELFKEVKYRLRKYYRYIWIKNSQILIKNDEKTYNIKYEKEIKLYEPSQERIMSDFMNESQNFHH